MRNPSFRHGSLRPQVVLPGGSSNGFDFSARSISRLAFFFYISLSPVYLFPSGQPQVADYFVLVSMFFYFLGGRIPYLRPLLELIVLSSLFILYCFCVSLLWAIMLSSFETAIPPVFYLFNFIAMWLFILMCMEDLEITLRMFAFGLAGASAIVLIAIVIGADFDARRQTGLFNNPNQLGYFGILSVSSVLLMIPLSRKFRISGVILSLVGFVGVFAVILSFSLTAMASLVIVLPSYFLIVKRRLLFAFIAPIGLVALLFFAGGFSSNMFLGYLDEQMEYRLSKLERKTEGFSDARGYSRIFEYPGYLVFGAAERARWRFSETHSNELHSTIGTILFSYGILGLLLFSMFLFSVLRRAEAATFLVFMAPMIYSLTHQGLRTTLFWVLLGLIYVISNRGRLFFDSRKRQDFGPSSQLHSSK